MTKDQIKLERILKEERRMTANSFAMLEAYNSETDPKTQTLMLKEYIRMSHEASKLFNEATVLTMGKPLTQFKQQPAKQYSFEFNLYSNQIRYA